MKRVSFHTLGCKVNFAETSTLAREFAAAGYTKVSEDEVADVYVVNTCSVTAAADKKCRNLIARLHRTSPAARIVVTGCYAALAPERLRDIPGVWAVLADKTKIVEQFSNFQIPKFPNYFFPAYSVGDRTRSFLKVQDGCDYKCAYCTIHAARGESRNAPIAAVVEQARAIAARGVREIVLTGVNTGDFGRSTGESFIELIRALDNIDSTTSPSRGVERFRISSIEPNLLTDEIIDFCASSRRFQPHFHVPLQSGSDRVLGLMRRRYTTAGFAERIERVRRVMPEAFIGVDVIVGFPGETEADFEATRRFLAELRPAQLHVFPFSPRPGTPAATMPNPVPSPVAAARAALLGALSDELHGEFTARHKGRRAQVLWEAENHRGLMTGFTGNYIKVTAPYDPALVGTITETTI